MPVLQALEAAIKSAEVLSSNLQRDPDNKDKVDEVPSDLEGDVEFCESVVSLQRALSKTDLLQALYESEVCVGECMGAFLSAIYDIKVDKMANGDHAYVITPKNLAKNSTPHGTKKELAEVEMKKLGDWSEKSSSYKLKMYPDFTAADVICAMLERERHLSKGASPPWALYQVSTSPQHQRYWSLIHNSDRVSQFQPAKGASIGYTDKEGEFSLLMIRGYKNKELVMLIDLPSRGAQSADPQKERERLQGLIDPEMKKQWPNIENVLVNRLRDPKTGADVIKPVYHKDKTCTVCVDVEVQSAVSVSDHVKVITACCSSRG